MKLKLCNVIIKKDRENSKFVKFVVYYVHSLRRVIKMMHTLCKYADETELVISDIITRDNGDEVIRVVFERPTEHGFDTLIFELPSYKIVEKDGQYTEEEIELFKKVVEQGAAHFFEIAREGGLESA